MKNKEKILLAATHLFNERGFVNVRLQHISDETIISLGNIAYHYKNKEAIVQAIFEAWEQQQRELLIEYRHTPIFENINRIFPNLQALQTAYRFFFLDALEIKRSYPDLFQKIRQFFDWQVFFFQDILRFNVARGAMHPMDEETTAFVSRLVVQQLNTWPYTVLLWQSADSVESPQLADHVWALLQPYLSVEGKEELRVLQEQTVPISQESNSED